MTFKKRVTKTIALGLVAVSVSSSSNLVVFANTDIAEGTLSNIEVNTNTENLLEQYNMSETDVQVLITERNSFTDETPMIEIFSEEQVSLSKMEFQQRYGTEDLFIFVEETDGIKTEVNPAQGIIKLTDIATGEVDTLNFFANLDTLRLDAIEAFNAETRAPSRPSSHKTYGPDKANLSVVKGSTRGSVRKMRNPYVKTN